MLRDSPSPTVPLGKSLLVNSHFTAYPGCVQASNATASSTLNSFWFKSYDVLLLLIITLLGLIKHTLTLTLTYHLPLPIRQLVQKIRDDVRKKQLDQKILCNQQRIRNPRLIDRNAFTLLIGKITHHAISLVSRELDAAKSLAERILSIVPVGGSCVYDCELPLRYGLPCKCWLYKCIIDSVPIPVSLIHPRWFLNGPPYAVSWQMTFDFARGSEPEVEKIVDEVEGTGEIEADKDEVELEEGVLSEDRFRRGGLDLLHSVAYQSIDLQSIEDSHRREEYAREHAHIVEKFNKKWQKKELVRPLIPTTFPNEIRPQKNLMHKKKGVVDVPTLVARQLRLEKLNSDVLGEGTLLNKGGGLDIIDCVLGATMRLKVKQKVKFTMVESYCARVG